MKVISVTEESKPVPEYARHLDQRTYNHWSQEWKYFDYMLPQLKTPEHAAVFLMIAAVEADKDTSKYLTYNDGHSIPPMAALPQYRAPIAAAGMEIAVTRLFDLEKYGITAFKNLVQAAYYKPAIWTAKTMSRFAELASAIPVDEITKQDPDEPWAGQPDK